MDSNTPPTTAAMPDMRALMPKGHLRLLMVATGCRQRTTISDVVLFENSGSKYWPAVLELAEKTDPTGFARWAAANPQKLPVLTAA